MKVKTTLDVASNKITSLATPTASTDAATKGYVDSASSAAVTSSDSAPSSPSTGTLWFDSTAGALYIYYDSQWVAPNIAGSVSSSSALTTTSSALASDVTMTTANTFYSGPSVSLTAGTWLVTAQATVSSANNAAQRITARIDDGAAGAFYAEAEQSTPAAGSNTRATGTVNMVRLVTLTATTTLRVQATATNASAILRAEAGDNSSVADMATVIDAVKVA